MFLSLLLAGCTTTVRFPPDLWEWEFVDTGWDTSRDTGAPLVTPAPVGDLGTASSAELRCDPGGTVWLAEVETVGWTDGVTVYLGSGAAVPEAHGLLLAESHPEGAWDRYLGGPWTAGVAPTELDPATGSIYTCSDAEVSWAFVVVDRFGQVSDCVIDGGVDAAFTDALLAVDPRLSEGDCHTP